MSRDRLGCQTPVEAPEERAVGGKRWPVRDAAISAVARSDARVATSCPGRESQLVAPPDSSSTRPMRELAAIRLRSTARRRGLLDWGARNVAKAAKDAAVAWLRFQQGATARALVEVLARIGRHAFSLRYAAERTRQRTSQYDVFHPSPSSLAERRDGPRAARRFMRLTPAAKTRTHFRRESLLRLPRRGRR